MPLHRLIIDEGIHATETDIKEIDIDKANYCQFNKTNWNVSPREHSPSASRQNVCMEPPELDYTCEIYLQESVENLLTLYKFKLHDVTS